MHHSTDRIVHTTAFVTPVCGALMEWDIVQWVHHEGSIQRPCHTFYLRLYGVRHMVKNHSDSEKGNPLLPHRLLFPISSKGYFICTTPWRIDLTTHLTMSEHSYHWPISRSNIKCLSNLEISGQFFILSNTFWLVQDIVSGPPNIFISRLVYN